MKYRIIGLTAAFSALLAGPLAAQDLDIILVTNPGDSGDGTLRAALAEPTQGAKRIVIATDGDITLESGLVYDQGHPLFLSGSGQALRLAKNETLLSVIDGTRLQITDIDFEMPGRYGIENRADLDGPAGKGIFFKVGADSILPAEVKLNNVYLAGAPGHGIHISDCDLGDDCGANSDSEGNVSSASIEVTMTNVLIEYVGYGKFDADGLRVDEGGSGDIKLVGTKFNVFSAGADGIELDEGGDGNVSVRLSNSGYASNGGYCKPELLAPFMPDVLEAEFDPGTMQESDIPSPVTGSPDDRCIEREVGFHDDGSVAYYEFGIDFDDGFDIDESGDGFIYAYISDIDVSRSTDEGLDFDEAGDGSLIFSMVASHFGENGDDGVKLSEEGEGHLEADVARSTALRNEGKGFVFEEADRGNLEATVVRAEIGGNGDANIEAVQEDSGRGALYVVLGAVYDGIEADGVTLTSN